MYTKLHGELVVEMLLKKGFNNPVLIGSLGRGETSKNDVDILLSEYENTTDIKNKLSEALENKGAVENTDWGGIYFHETLYGTIDIFFSDKDFDF